MTEQQIQEFLTKVANDESFKAEILELNKKMEAKKISEKDGKDFISKVVLPKAKKLGYDFTEVDFVEFSKSQELASLMELSPEDLENVSGGVSAFVLGAVALLGWLGFVSHANNARSSYQAEDISAVSASITMNTTDNQLRNDSEAESLEPKQPDAVNVSDADVEPGAITEETPTTASSVVPGETAEKEQGTVSLDGAAVISEATAEETPTATSRADTGAKATLSHSRKRAQSRRNKVSKKKTAPLNIEEQIKEKQRLAAEKAGLPPLPDIPVPQAPSSEVSENDVLTSDRSTETTVDFSKLIQKLTAEYNKLVKRQKVLEEILEDYQLQAKDKPHKKDIYSANTVKVQRQLADVIHRELNLLSRIERLKSYETTNE